MFKYWICARHYFDFYRVFADFTQSVLQLLYIFEKYEFKTCSIFFWEISWWSCLGSRNRCNSSDCWNQRLFAYNDRLESRPIINPTDRQKQLIFSFDSKYVHICMHKLFFENASKKATWMEYAVLLCRDFSFRWKFSLL